MKAEMIKESPLMIKLTQMWTWMMKKTREKRMGRPSKINSLS